MNQFAFLSQGVRPDTGVDARDYQNYTIYSCGNESVQLRIRKHGHEYSAGYFFSFKDKNLLPVELFPSCSVGVFSSERDAKLFALGEILEHQYPMSSPARETLLATIDELRTLSFF